MVLIINGNTHTSNYKAVLTTSELTTLIYGWDPRQRRLSSLLRVSNIDEENDCKISVYLVDTDSVSYNLETNRVVQKGTSEELI
jgi:hypothetical protein